MSPATAADIAAELERAAAAALKRNLDLLAEAGQVRTLGALVEFQTRAAEAMVGTALADAALLARAAMRALDAAAPQPATPDLSTRAMKSGLAHAGEPPDYAADNE